MLLVVAAALLASPWILLRTGAGDGWVERLRPKYQIFLKRLETEALRTVSHLGEEVAAKSRSRAFGELQQLASAGGDPRLAYVLLDQDCEAVAWAGAGLLHDVEGMALPLEGAAFIASHTAISVFSVQPIASDTRPWRVLVGGSYPRDQLPFDPGLGLDRSAFRWSLSDESSGSPGGAVLSSSYGLSLWVERERSDPATQAPLAGRPWAAGLLGVTFLVLLFRDLRERAGSPEGEGPTLIFLVASAFLGTVCLFGAFGLTARGFLALALAASFVLAALRAATRTQEPMLLVWRFALGTAVLFLLGFLYQSGTRSLDLGSRFLVDAESFALRIALVLVALSVFCVKGQRGNERSSLWTSLSFALLLAAASLHDRPSLALPLLLAAAASGATWLPTRRPSSGSRPITLVVVVFAALIAATAWETSFRWVKKRELASRLEADVRLPAPATLNTWKEEMESFLLSAEARRLIRQRVERSEMQDLAVAMWRKSPLARRDALSALVLDAGENGISSFSYGLPLGGDGVDAEALSALVAVGGRRELVGLEGTVFLDLEGRPWGEAFFWLFPLRPLEIGSTVIANLEIDLLRGGPLAAIRRRAPGEGSVAIYSLDGAVIRSSWPVSPPLPEGLRAQSSGKAPTPDGSARFWSVIHDGAIFRLYLPILDLLDGLERVGTHAVSVLLLASGGILLLLFLSLPESDVRRRSADWFRSYSKRLIMVFTLMVLLPLLVLNLVLFRTMGDRLEAEHREAGEVALRFAQRVLGDYLLNLAPGFDLRTVIDNEVLDWLAQVVQREVNVYWDSRYFASSKPELISAGLLPEQIPGEVYSSLALEGSSLAARTNRIGDVSYLELYGPIAVEAAAAGPLPSFYVSTPLVGQEEEVSAQLNQLARQAFLVTVALFLLLLAAGPSLAQSFTRPLMEIVEGTDRIAAGATSLELSPREPELASLVQAIDEMAERIAEGRRELLHEKQVVEEVVEHITAGVISLDGDHRILMHNRVANELLGVATGEHILAIKRRPELAPVVMFLEGVSSRAEQTTVRLRSEGDEELDWSLVWVPVAGAGEPSALFVVEDATEILRGQRLQAWAEMARMIAHEVKNPLTPIRLSTEHLKQVYSEDRDHLHEVFERCTDNILEQVEELQRISLEFSTYSHIPTMNLQEGDLRSLAESIAAAYHSSSAAGVTVRLRRESERVEALFDAKLMGRACRNLLENAVRANDGAGEVEVRVGKQEGQARIVVSDQGPGIPIESMSRIFEPYFSTHDSGIGLGLPIAKRIVEEHGGTISARNRKHGGLRVSICLPLLRPSGQQDDHTGRNG